MEARPRSPTSLAGGHESSCEFSAMQSSLLAKVALPGQSAPLVTRSLLTSGYRLFPPGPPSSLPLRGSQGHRTYLLIPAPPQQLCRYLEAIRSLLGGCATLLFHASQESICGRHFGG